MTIHAKKKNKKKKLVANGGTLFATDTGCITIEIQNHLIVTVFTFDIPLY